MGTVTQEAYFRQRVLNYAAKHGVTAAAIQYHMSRKAVHKWKKTVRWDSGKPTGSAAYAPSFSAPTDIR